MIRLGIKDLLSMPAAGAAPGAAVLMHRSESHHLVRRLLHCGLVDTSYDWLPSIQIEEGGVCGMRVFISWSGKESKAVAEILKVWLPLVIQTAEPYVSSQDIEKGERWSTNIASHLTEIDFGIIIATPMNIEAAWINFEAGALSKSVRSRVVPLLCGMERIDAATSPLRQFQYALATEEDMFKLLESLNEASEKPLPYQRLELSFKKWWPDFEEKFRHIKFKQAASSPKNPEDENFAKLEGALEAILGDISEIKRRIPVRNATESLGDLYIPNNNSLYNELVAASQRAAEKRWKKNVNISTSTHKMPNKNEQND